MTTAADTERFIDG